jgi:hypothetical protein
LRGAKVVRRVKESSNNEGGRVMLKAKAVIVGVLLFLVCVVVPVVMADLMGWL